MAITDILDDVSCPYCGSRDLERVRPVETETSNRWVLVCLNCEGEFVI